MTGGSIYQVIELIGSSSESWEEAARNAVREAASTYHVFDAQLSYVVKRDYIKGAIGYTRHQNVDSEASGDAFYVGVQISK